MSPPVFRFAPSPNGRLHLGHAASALLNARLAQKTNGRLLLRVEDIDTTRSREEFVTAIGDDLAWLGLNFESPALRQSTRFGLYAQALARLSAQGLTYPCFCSRASLMQRASGQSRAHPLDPDGAPRYDGLCRHLPAATVARRLAAGEPCALRLNMEAALAQIGAPVTWTEGLPGTTGRTVQTDPAAWGDAVIQRKEFPASYHIAVVVDDAAQGVTHVVRGLDLFHATSIHRVLQTLLGLPAPEYHHHALLLDAEGDKLAKSRGSQALADLRAAGMTADEVIRRATLPHP
jgi:glutamyl-Q tRNA(Asp) synthetase